MNCEKVRRAQTVLQATVIMRSEEAGVWRANVNLKAPYRSLTEHFTRCSAQTKEKICSKICKGNVAANRVNCLQSMSSGKQLPAVTYPLLPTLIDFAVDLMKFGCGWINKQSWFLLTNPVWPRRVSCHIPAYLLFVCHWVCIVVLRNIYIFNILRLFVCLGIQGKTYKMVMKTVLQYNM